jgi:lysine 2,3-aminomutase
MIAEQPRRLSLVADPAAPGMPAPQPVPTHRRLVDGEFWQRIPAYRAVSRVEFLDHRFQMKNSITRVDDLLRVIRDLAPRSFYDDVVIGLARAPMSIRLSPYLLSLIDWDDPYRDPIRRQFLPVGSSLLPDHPMLGLDSLEEQEDSPVPGLVHRYRDRALLLALDTCPVYCRFCTRSYAVGGDTESVGKVSLKAKEDRWQAAFDYLASRPDIEDVVVSGGDCYNLRPAQIEHIGNALLALPSILRIRLGTKGPAVMPQKILTDQAWVDAVLGVAERGRRLGKEVALHVHFNHPREITQLTKDAMDLLFAHGVILRNQAVLQRGVNDSVGVMRELTRRLSYCHVQPYYVYIHDLVSGLEDLRTTVQTAVELEKRVRGDTAGFNTPTFVCDAPHGGGKRSIHSYEHYDRQTGIAVYVSPAVKTGYFLYFDPIDCLSEPVREAWQNPLERRRMIESAVAAARDDMRRHQASTTVDMEDADGPIHLGRAQPAPAHGLPT